MAIDAHDPGKVRRYLAGDFQQGARELRHLLAPRLLESRRTRREQHLGLEHEAVVDDVDAGAVAQDLAQPAEELGTVALQLLDLAGEREVELAAQVRDHHALRLGLGRGDIEGLGEPRQLLAQGGDLLVEELDPGARPRRQPVLPGQLLVALLQCEAQLVEANLAVVDLLLRQRRAFGLVAQACLERLGAVALGGQVGAQGGGQSPAVVELGGGCIERGGRRLQVRLVGLERRRELAELCLELAAHLAQHGDVAAQAGQLGELQLKRLAVGRDGLVGFGQRIAQRLGFGRGKRRLVGRRLEAQHQRVALRQDRGKLGRQYVARRRRALQFGR